MFKATDTIMRLISQDRANGHERMAQLRELIWDRLQSSEKDSADQKVVASEQSPAVAKASLLASAIAMLKGMLRRFGVEFFVYDSFAYAGGAVEGRFLDLIERSVQLSLKENDLPQLRAMIHAEQFVGIVVPDKVKLPFPIPLGGEAVGGDGSLRQMLVLHVGNESSVEVVEGCDIRNQASQSLLHARHIQLGVGTSCRWQSFRKSQADASMSIHYSAWLEDRAELAMVAAQIAGKCVESSVRAEGGSAKVSYVGTSLVEGCRAPNVATTNTIIKDGRYFERTQKHSDLDWDDVVGKFFSGKIAAEYFVELESRRIEGLCFRQIQL
jgi:hypothetical protein